MKVALALYKYKTPGWGLYATFDRLSRFVGGRRVDDQWVNGKYSHSELLVPMSDNTWLSLSSSFRDGGVREKVIDYSTGRWDFIYIDKTENEVNAIKDRFSVLVGCRYDWPALGRFLFGKWWFVNPRWWFFCSEICAFLLRLAEPIKWHPSSFADLKLPIIETLGAPNDI